MAKYKIDLDALTATLETATGNCRRLGVDLLMALKGFPFPPAFPTLAPFVSGVTASGLFESKLGTHLGKAVHVHAPAYTAEEMPEIRKVCSHVGFNSLSQLARFGAETAAAGCHVGLRVNPGFSSAACLTYDPCCPDSRFGVLTDELAAVGSDALACVDGLHIHALCEGYSDDFAGMVEKFTALLQRLSGAPLDLSRIKWINLGGGEVINDPAFASPRAVAAVAALKRLGDFEVFIEPSEYICRYAGSVEAEVLDVIHREKDIAVLDFSLVCHATDCIIYNMKPEVVSPALAAPDAPSGRTTILGAVSCLAGDVMGEYRFARPLRPGDKIVFGGLGCYSFAQQSWFNGIRHPDIVLVSQAKGEETVLSWTYADYEREFLGQPV